MTNSYHTTIDLSDRLGPYLKMGLEKYAAAVDAWDGWTLDGDLFTYFAGAGDTSTWMYGVASAAFHDKETVHGKWAMYDALYDMAYRLQSGTVWCVTVTPAEPTDADLIEALGRGIEAGEFFVFNPAA